MAWAMARVQYILQTNKPGALNSFFLPQSRQPNPKKGAKGFFHHFFEHLYFGTEGISEVPTQGVKKATPRHHVYAASEAEWLWFLQKNRWIEWKNKDRDKKTRKTRKKKIT